MSAREAIADALQQLTAERDMARANVEEYRVLLSAALAERDEAVQLLREAPTSMTSAKRDYEWRSRRDALLIRAACSPGTTTTEGI